MHRNIKERGQKECWTSIDGRWKNYQVEIGMEHCKDGINWFSPSFPCNTHRWDQHKLSLHMWTLTSDFQLSILVNDELLSDYGKEGFSKKEARERAAEAMAHSGHCVCIFSFYIANAAYPFFTQSRSDFSFTTVIWWLVEVDGYRDPDNISQLRGFVSFELITSGTAMFSTCLWLVLNCRGHLRVMWTHMCNQLCDSIRTSSLERWYHDSCKYTIQARIPHTYLPDTRIHHRSSLEPERVSVRASEVLGLKLYKPTERRVRVAGSTIDLYHPYSLYYVK